MILKIVTLSTDWEDVAQGGLSLVSVNEIPNLPAAFLSTAWGATMPKKLKYALNLYATNYATPSIYDALLQASTAVGGESDYNSSNDIDQQILSAMEALQSNSQQSQGCSDRMTVSEFMDLIDEVTRVRDLRSQIGALQVELGFDDDVAAYLLVNAPDGADDKTLIILAISSICGPHVDVFEASGLTDVEVIDDAKDIIPLTTRIRHFDYTEDIKVTSLLSDKFKADATTSALVLSNLHTKIIFQKETTNTPFVFISETTDLVGWRIGLSWVEDFVNDGVNSYLPSQHNVHVEGKLEEGFKINYNGFQFLIGKATHVEIIAGMDKKTGKGTMRFKSFRP